jgi:hypothetical protein
MSAPLSIADLRPMITKVLVSDQGYSHRVDFYDLGGPP